MTTTFDELVALAFCLTSTPSGIGRDGGRTPLEHPACVYAPSHLRTVAPTGNWLSHLTQTPAHLALNGLSGDAVLMGQVALHLDAEVQVSAT
jgi:hypothetical protein